MAEIDEFERQVFAAVHELVADIARIRQSVHCM